METAVRIETFQYALTKPECKLFRDIRNQRASNNVPISKNLVKGTVVPVYIQCGNRRVLMPDIDSENATWELATIGTRIAAAYRSGDWSGLRYEEVNRTEQAKEKQPEVEPIPPTPEDRDSVLGTQDLSQLHSAARLPSWQIVKEHIIPDYVKLVSFTVDPNEVSEEQRQDLRERFPDVKVRLTTPPPTGQSAGVGTPNLHPSDTPVGLQIEDSQQNGAETLEQSFSGEQSPQSAEDLPSPGFRIQGAAAVQDAAQDSVKIKGTGSVVSMASKDLGVDFEHPTTVQNMYDLWMNSRELPEIQEKDVESLRTFCIDLLDLYIIAEWREEDSLSHSILLRWQEASVCNSDFIIPLDKIMPAFDSDLVSPDSPLRKWIAIFYAFLWPTTDEGSYEDFCEKYEYHSSERLPSEAFLFDIAFIRCSETKGQDTAVLDRWCEVHDHPDTPEGEDEKWECEEWRDRVSDLKLKRLKEKAEDVALRAAKKMVKHNGFTIARSSVPSAGLSVNTPTGPRARGQGIKTELESSPRKKGRPLKRSLEDSSPRTRGRLSKRASFGRGRGAH